MCDQNMANWKNAACLAGVGFLGLRCRHCGGNVRGSYFPSSCKNLQACPSTLYSHILKCALCPDITKHVRFAHKMLGTKNHFVLIDFNFS